MIKNDDFFYYLFHHPGIAEITSPPDCEWMRLIDAQLVSIQYRKGQLLLIAGDVPDQLFFLQQGALRAYKYGKDGRGYTFYLWAERAIVTDVVNFMDERPSDLYIEVSKGATLLSISRTALGKILAAHPEAILFFYMILLNYTRYHRERDMDQLLFDPGYRLEKLKLSRSGLLRIFRKDHIASFLGISRSWLFGMKSKKPDHNS